MTRPIFITLFAVYPLLHIVSINPGQVSWKSVLIALTFAIVAANATWAIVRFFNRSWSRAAIATAFLILLFFTYGPVHSTVETFCYDNIARGSLNMISRIALVLHPVLCTIWVLLGFAGLRLIHRKMSEDRAVQLIPALNGVALVLFAMAAVSIGIDEIQLAAHMTEDEDVDPSRGLATSVLGYNPDIYHIVLDGYSRKDVLKRVYGFDNSKFLDGLEKRGFTVKDKSTGNYYFTQLSMGSFLNLNYLQTLLGDKIPPNSHDGRPVYEIIRNNLTARFLRDRGYQHIHFQTTWGATLFNPYADEQIRCHADLFQDEYFRVLAEASWLKALQPRVSANIAECHLSNLKTLAEMGTHPGPKYVYAHFIPPHHPYLFDRKGNILRQANLSNQFEWQKRLWQQKEGYVDQLIFMNKKITEVVDQILATSPQPPIIIIQSDHGTSYRKGFSRKEQYQNRFANLAAYYLPGASKDLIPENVSLVNQNRRIFNHYFQAGFEILPVRYYWSDYHKPHDFKEVLKKKGPRTLAHKNGKKSATN